MASRPAWQAPVQWPDGATASDAGLVVRERLLKSALVFAMLALTVLDRFGLLGLVGFAMPAMYAVAGAMVLARAAELNPRATFAYLAMVGVATLSLLVNAAVGPLPFVSIGSFALLIGLYAPFCVSLRQGAVAPELWRWTVNLYIAFAVFVGVAGIAQFLVQFVFHPEWLFDYTPLIPERLRLPGLWNTDYTVSAATGSRDLRGEHVAGAWAKSNGFFMREASNFSIVMAFGLVCELSMARRNWVMSVLVLGLMLSYSGAGLLSLAVAMLFPIARSIVMRVLAFVILAAAIVVVFGDVLNLSLTLNRYEEFLNERTSGYCRMVGPPIEVVRHFASEPWTSLLGNGPGSMPRMIAACYGQFATTYAKAFFEYGVVGTLALGVLMFGTLNRSSAPVRIRVAWVIAWLLVTGSLLDPSHLLFIYIVSAMWPRDAARKLESGAPGLGGKRPSFHQAPKANIGTSVIHAER